MITPVKCVNCGEQSEIAFDFCQKCGDEMKPLQDNFELKEAELSLCDKCLHQQKRTQSRTGKCYCCMFSPENQ